MTDDIRVTAREIYDAQMALDPADHKGQSDLHVRWTQDVTQPICDTLSGMTAITALVVSGDIASAYRADFALEDGTMGWERCMHLVGSYARGEWVRRHIDSGDIDLTAVDIVALWRDSDPDDSSDWWADTWQAVVSANDGMMLTDSDVPLPVEDDDTLYIYRGQLAGAPVGLAWSTDRFVAEKFALSGGGRSTMLGGKVLEGTCDPRDVLGWLTGRGESEVVVLPENVAYSQ